MTSLILFCISYLRATSSTIVPYCLHLKKPCVATGTSITRTKASFVCVPKTALYLCGKWKIVTTDYRQSSQ